MRFHFFPSLSHMREEEEERKHMKKKVKVPESSMDFPAGRNMGKRPHPHQTTRKRTSPPKGQVCASTFDKPRFPLAVCCSLCNPPISILSPQIRSNFHFLASRETENSCLTSMK